LQQEKGPRVLNGASGRGAKKKKFPGHATAGRSEAKRREVSGTKKGKTEGDHGKGKAVVGDSRGSIAIEVAKEDVNQKKV